MVNYLYITLWVVFFYDAIVLLLLPSSVNFILGTDGSAARYAVDFLSLSIGSYVLVKQGFNKLENKWIGLFLLAVVISHFHSPNIKFESLFLPKDMAIYNYKPMFEVLCLFLMFLGIASLELTQKFLKKFFSSMCWIAVIYSAYMILQRLGLDQIYHLTKEQSLNQMSRNPECGGFISQPVFAAVFLVTSLPFVIKNKVYWMMALVVLGILVTGNRAAMMAMVVCSLMSFRKTYVLGKVILIGYFSLMVGYLIVHMAFPQVNLYFSDERLEVWKNLIVDFFVPSFPGVNSHYILTGHGLGSFSVLFPFYHKSSYYQAHNELLELIWSTGLIGLGIFIMVIKNLLTKKICKTIGLSLLAMSICSFTNAVWHIPQLAFLTVFLTALIYNKSIGVNYDMGNR